jgi:hypothetical protein
VVSGLALALVECLSLQRIHWIPIILLLLLLSASMPTSLQGCHKERFWRKITVRTSEQTRPRPRGCWGAFAQTPMSARTQPMSARTHLPPLPSPSLPSVVRTDAGLRPLGCEKNLQITIFGFRFSIPKIPKLRGLRGRSREKKVFLA